MGGQVLHCGSAGLRLRHIQSNEPENTMKNLDPKIPPTPCFVVDLAALRRNLEILNDVRQRAGVKILLAQKAFSAFDTYPLIAKYLDGTTASGLYEARLAPEEMPTRENHVFNPAFTDEEFAAAAKWCDHIVLNTVGQVRRFKTQLAGRGARPKRIRRVSRRMASHRCRMGAGSRRRTLHRRGAFERSERRTYPGCRRQCRAGLRPRVETDGRLLEAARPRKTRRAAST